VIWFTIFHCQFHFLFSDFYGRVRHPSRNVQSERYSKRGLYIPHRFVLRRRPNQVKSDRVYMGSWGLKVFVGPAVDVTNMNTWIAKCFCRNRLERQTRETDEIGWKKRNKVIEIEKGDNQQSRTSRNRNLCWRFFTFLTFGHGEAKCFSSDMKNINWNNKPNKKQNSRDSFNFNFGFHPVSTSERPDAQTALDNFKINWQNSSWRPT
jgi:hypothetical protein